MTVDDFVNSKFPLEHRETVATLRALVRECAPHAQEAVSYGMPVFKGRTIFAWIIPNKKGITLGFTRGARFEDKFDLLRGAGKSGRHIKIRNAGSLDRDVLRYYIGQALDLDVN